MSGVAWRGLLLGVGAGAVEPGGFEGLKGNPWMLVGMLVTVLVTSSLAEEVIYRGYLLLRLAGLSGDGKAGWFAALVVGSAAFGMAYWDWGIAGVIRTGAMGFALGAGYVWCGKNLWVPVVAHGLMDTLLLLVLYFGG